MNRLRTLAWLLSFHGLVLAGCTSAEGDLILGDGYRGPDDPCRGIGEFFTNDPDDDSPDLVGCPVDGAATVSARILVPLNYTRAPRFRHDRRWVPAAATCNQPATAKKTIQRQNESLCS